MQRQKTEQLSLLPSCLCGSNSSVNNARAVDSQKANRSRNSKGRKPGGHKIRPRISYNDSTETNLRPAKARQLGTGLRQPLPGWSPQTSPPPGTPTVQARRRSATTHPN